LVRDVGKRDVWVQSFDARDLALTAELSSRIPLAYLVETEQDLVASLGMPYGSVHMEHVLLDEAMHRRLTGAGKAIGVWTVNKEADLRRVIRLGVEVVITDEPLLARRIVDELCAPA
jgi:glycerophosphoryl diester phosphodiesterase